MSVLKSFENTVAGLVEGVFGRIFRSEVRPMELAHKLTREMDDHRTASVSRVYAPNEYLVWLSPEDRDRHADIEHDLIDELCAYLLEHARREQLTLVARPRVEFHTDERLSLGEFGIQARLVRLGADGAAHDAGYAEDGGYPDEGVWADEGGYADDGVYAEPAAPGPAAPGPAGRAEPDGGEAGPGHTMIYSSAERLRGPLADASRARQARAFVRIGGKRLAVAPAGASLGRSRGCDIVIDDPGVSRRHAEIRPGPDGWAIADLGSTNGVYVNRAQIEGPCPLASGDVIELGETEIAFESS